MDIDLLIEVLEEQMPSLQYGVDRLPIHETFLTLPVSSLRDVVRLLTVRFGATHLSTIAGEDTGREIVLLYHFWDGQGLTLRVELPRDDPSVESLRDLVPGAVFYEREVVEMLGVRINGYNQRDRLFLPDDWDGGPPMRKQETDTQ